MQPKVQLIYTDGNQNTHRHSFGVKNYEWGLLLTQTGAQDATYFTNWANVVKPLVSTTTNLTGFRLINADGSVAKEYIAGSPVAGTHTVVVGSASGTIGFTYASFAPGVNGKGHHGTSHLKTGHADFWTTGDRQKATSTNASIDAYRTWLVANMPVATGADQNSLFRSYFTIQRNVYYQRKYGD